MAKRQILVELEIEDDDRLTAIASSIPDYLRLYWAQESTAEAFLAGKKALGIARSDLEVLRGALDASVTYQDEQIAYATKYPNEYGTGDIDAMIEARSRVEDLQINIKLQLGEAVSFHTHFTEVEDEHGDVKEIDIEPGLHLTDEQISRTWTVVDCDGRLGITPGLAYVNRLHYIQTTEPWTEDDFKKEWIY